MALGDYTKTTYNSGSAPGISATRLNNNEDKTKELDAETVSIQQSNAYRSLEITKLRMELVLTQLNSIGFYDLFDTLDDVNVPYTNATVDTTALDVTFLSEIYNLTVVSDVTSSAAVTTKETATVGDRISDTNAITGVVDNSINYDIANGSYDSVSFSVASQDTTPLSIAFNNDGTKLFMVGNSSDSIHQYSLPTPFVLTGMSYDSVSFSVGGQDTVPKSIAFNNDGTKLFMLGNSSNTIHQYSLPTPFVLTGMSYDSVSFSVGGQDTIPYSIVFNNDGTKLFMLGNSSNTIYQYSLSTPFVLTGMSYDSVSFNVASQDTIPYSIAFNNDGSKMFMLGGSSDSIYQYSTGEAFFDLTLTSPITALADDILEIYPNAYPYDTLTMDSQQFAVTAGNALVKLYTDDINNPLDLKYQVYINDVECTLIETLDYELTYELPNVNNNTIVLKVNGKDGVILDDLLVAIS